MTYKYYIYMVQGQADLVKNYMHLGDRAGVDAVYLTYDREMDGALYFPNSTWAEGRNRMMEEALGKGKRYEYYIYIDDDVEFKRGGWDRFEELLMRYRPAVGVPVVMKSEKTPFPLHKYQTFIFNDEQMMAFHREVVEDRILLPYQVRFDSVNWWASCEIQQILIQNFYSSNSLQFNEIEIANTERGRYEEGDENFRVVMNEWLDAQFAGRYRSISYYRKTQLRALWRTFVYGIKHKLGLVKRSVDGDVLETKLAEGSDLHQQVYAD